ncbi:MAG: hypothetical protein AAGE52_10940 [Myxococcota bacterium]
MSWDAELDARLGACDREAWDPGDWVSGLSLSDRVALARESRRRQRELPTPLSVHVDAPKHRLLERILGWCELLDGRSPARLLAAERVAWLRGGDSLAYLRRLREHGRGDEADALARAMGDPNAKTYTEDDLPHGFVDALLALGTPPDPTDFDQLLAPVPGPRRNAVLRYALLQLKERGVSGDQLFWLAAMELSPFALELVDEGIVAPEAIAERAKLAPPEAAPLWWSIAGRAAFVRGDMLGCIRWLRQAFDTGLVPKTMTLPWIWKRADANFRAMMQSAGLPVPAPTHDSQ